MTEFESMQSIVRMLDMAEREGLLQTFKNPLEIELGMVVAAPWKNKYRRARVMRQPDKQLNVSNFQVKKRELLLLISNFTIVSSLLL